MPIRELSCARCGASFEKIERASQPIEQVHCPCCGSHEVERKLSSFATPSGRSATAEPASMSSTSPCGMGNMCCMNRN